MSPDLFDTNGVAFVPKVLSDEECNSVAAIVQPTTAGSGGTRRLLVEPWCEAIARRLRSHGALTKIIAPSAVAVQCTYFEKSSGRNWLVPVHQDLSIPVAERVAAAELTGWAEKEGSLFVHAPAEILKQMVAVRIHLEACTASDGPLRVIPGSHVHGRLGSEVTQQVRDMAGEVVCLAEPGSAWAMRPSILHASSKASGSGRRRVLHFVFGPRVLPYGLEWQHAV